MNNEFLSTFIEGIKKRYSHLNPDCDVEIAKVKYYGIKEDPILYEHWAIVSKDFYYFLKTIPESDGREQTIFVRRLTENLEEKSQVSFIGKTGIPHEQIFREGKTVWHMMTENQGNEKESNIFMRHFCYILTGKQIALDKTQSFFVDTKTKREPKSSSSFELCIII